MEKGRECSPQRTGRFGRLQERGKEETSSSSSEASQDSPAGFCGRKAARRQSLLRNSPDRIGKTGAVGGGRRNAGDTRPESAGQAASRFLETGLLLGVSALFLAGLIFAKLYR